MSKLVGLVALLCVGLFAASASATPKAEICHKGKTLSVAAPAVKAHLAHGDKVGACKPATPPVTPPGTTPPGTTPTGDIPVTADTFKQVNRILACASKPVIRVADGTLGISVDLDLATFSSGVYAGATFTVARFYAGVGATCDKLGGAPTGTFMYDYPVWR